VPVLKTIRWEHLAQGLAQGLTLKAAGIKAGYSERSAEATVCKLAKRPDIKARIEELRISGNEVAAKTVGITKAWVIEGLQRTIEEARADKQYATVRGCYTDIGKELFHMFADRHEIDWLEQYKRAVTDPSTLSDKELAELTEFELQRTFHGDQKKIAAFKRKMLGPGEVIDVVPEPG
jgi:hypothetical protein